MQAVMSLFSIFITAQKCIKIVQNISEHPTLTYHTFLWGRGDHNALGSVFLC